MGLYDASMFMYCADNESEGLLPLADPPITELLLLLLITTETSWPSLAYNTVNSMYGTALVSHTHTSFTGWHKAISHHNILPYLNDCGTHIK